MQNAHPSLTDIILIADAGSTKTDWAVMRAQTTECTGHDVDEPLVISTFRTPGVNALLASEATLKKYFEDASAGVPSGCHVSAAYYYGAGCATPEICTRMAGAIADASGCAKAEVESDLLGAARSLFGDAPGIACILGTGSNSCLYDGTGISAHTPSLGYVLGDEGSGASIGRRLVSDCLKGIMPRRLRERMTADFQLTEAAALENVYRQPAPSRYLASFVPFAARNIEDDYMAEIITDEFHRFIERNVLPYERRDLPLRFIGGVAFTFRQMLETAAAGFGLVADGIYRNPLDGLVRYHHCKTNK